MDHIANEGDAARRDRACIATDKNPPMLGTRVRGERVCARERQRGHREEERKTNPLSTRAATWGIDLVSSEMPQSGRLLRASA